MRTKMPSILSVILMILACIFLMACQGTTVGNGKVDPVEAAVMRVAVGSAMTAYPAGIEPAYVVSTALLEVLSPDYVATASALDGIIARELDRLQLDPATKASFAELLALVRAQVVQTLATEKVPISDRRVMIRDLVLIVQQAAAARVEAAKVAK